MATTPSNAPTGCIPRCLPTPLGAGGVPLALVVDSALSVDVASVVLCLIDVEPFEVVAASVDDEDDDANVVDVDATAADELLAPLALGKLLVSDANVAEVWVLGLVVCSDPVAVLVAGTASTVLTSGEEVAAVVASAVLAPLLASWLSPVDVVSRVVVGATVTAPAVLVISGSALVADGPVVCTGVSTVSVVGAGVVIRKPCSS